ncbi:MAG: DUF1572 family protein [Saprospiraceae bacterium]|nr:DUF1572 family protein [Saprospiraceae bacterium]
MKDYLLQLAKYNVWANQRFFDVFSTLDQEQLEQEINSSFNSIRMTVKHMFDAEKGWWFRLNDPQFLYKFGEDYNGEFSELLKEFKEISQQWVRFIESSDEQIFQSKFKYRRANGEYESLIQDAIIHLFNHASYHRGQLVTMLRQVGSNKIPSTDFILYTREKTD